MSDSSNLIPATFLTEAMKPEIAELRQMQILIVDDEPVNVALLRGILNAAGFPRLESTSDSRLALKMVAELDPDLIVLDLMMPWIDGFQIMEGLAAQRAAGGFLPIMVLTADITEQTRKRALSVGATDFLTKPFDRTECVLRISNLLATRRIHRQLASQNEQLEEKVFERTAALEDALAELRAAQQQVVQRERLSALGAMVTGVAHDFNNSLALILGYGEKLQKHCRDAELTGEILDATQTIVTAALDAADSVGRLQSFHRAPGSDELRQPLAVGELIGQIVEFTRPRWEAESHARGVPIDVFCDLGRVPAVAGVASELREMLTNLIFNAVDAMPQGGGITLRTRAAGEMVVMEISDTGAGMSDDVRRRCLEPFFTTKGDRGAGLGLAMAYGIVQRHEGTISIDSAPGRGTRFTITFPADRSGQEAQPPAPADVSHRLKILVVDDQPVLCELLAENLQRDWHSVTTAANGRDALEKFGFGEFDLVITDKAMPEMNGDQLAVAIKAREPGARVIMLTGFGDPGGEETSEFIDAVLSKPVTPADLRAGIARVMTGK